MLLTEPAWALNVAVVAPAGTAIEAGTVSAWLFAESVTVAPPLEVGDETVTMQVELAPEATLVGVHCNPVIAGSAGITVTAAVPEVALSPAVIVTV